MSEFFDLDDYGARDQEQQAQLYGIREDQIQPEFFDGSIEALPRGVVSGSLALGRATTLAGAVAPMAYDAVFNDNNEATDWYFKNTTQRYDDARDVMTATADDLGAAGKFIEGLTSMGTQIAGGGGISGLVASTQLNTGADLIREGVDVNTAQAVGAVDAVATGVGAWLPVFGKSIGARVVGNAIANPAVGVLDRGINNTILSANGYDEAAKKYDLFDAQSMVVDAAIGALFGRFMKPTNMLDSVVGQKAGDAWRFHQSLKPSEKDAIAVAAQQKHMVVDSAPGKPVDRRVMETHSANMQEAVDALATGRQANIKELSDTDFVPRDGDMTPAQRDAEVKNILDEMDRENDVADGGVRSLGDVDPEANRMARFYKDIEGLDESAAADLLPFNRTDRSVVSGMHSDRELLGALERAAASDKTYRYTESEVHNGGGINKKMGANAKANAVIKEMGEAFAKAFDGAHPFHRGGWRFAAVVPEGFDIKAAQAKADAAMEAIIDKHNLREIKAEKGGQDGTRFWHGESEIKQGSDIDKIISPAQDAIKAQKPQEVADVNRSEAVKAGAKSLSGQARRVVERIRAAGSDSKKTRAEREATARSAAEGIGVHESSRATSGARQRVADPLVDAVDPITRAERDFNSAAEKHNLSEVQRAKLAPQINRDPLTGWFTDTDRAATVERAKSWSDITNKPSSYGVLDISNLGGLNEALGQHAADVVWRSMAQTVLKHVNEIGADIIPFRHGGDEFAFVALGADEKLLAEAIEKGKKDVQRYINAVGLQDIPHLKDINDAARKGSGIYAGTKNIEKGVATAEQLDDADALVEVNKKLGKPDVQGEKLALVDENAIGKKSENVEAKPAAAKPISKQTDPELQQLEAVLSERGDVLVPADSTVNPLTGKVEANAEPLSAAVARMSEEKTEAQSLADSVIEAANCFLRG